MLPVTDSGADPAQAVPVDLRQPVDVQDPMAWTAVTAARLGKSAAWEASEAVGAFSLGRGSNLSAARGREYR
ncbi:hypothetical protein GCM10022224_009280 [Nonomuraea antimicrobica]|uniref:Uncharacterized protein n=1 Tax=Nonomuraea antimicrobica TaxID=561173 RepID=A0ABP7B576_9ACTN